MRRKSSGSASPTSGGTTLPALVISQQKLDEKHGLKIEWVRLDQAALQKAFALRQFDVSFAEVASDLIRQRARGDKVKSIYAASWPTSTW